MGNLTGIITFWYLDHESNNNLLTDINVLMSEGTSLISNTIPFTNCKHSCIEELDGNNNYCYYICYTFNTDPITCDNNWYKYNNYLNTNSIIIKSNQCIADTFPTAPTSSTFAPSKPLTKTPIIAANNIHKSICLSNVDGSLDGTFSNGQIFIKSTNIYQTIFTTIKTTISTYLLYYLNSWLLYRCYNNNNLRFLKCSLKTYNVQTNK